MFEVFQTAPDLGRDFRRLLKKSLEQDEMSAGPARIAIEHDPERVRGLV